jgi:hypothetical protein
MKNAVFWDVTSCGSCKNRHFGGTSVPTRATQLDIPEDGISLNLDEYNTRSSSHRKRTVRVKRLYMRKAWRTE